MNHVTIAAYQAHQLRPHRKAQSATDQRGGQGQQNPGIRNKGHQVIAIGAKAGIVKRRYRMENALPHRARKGVPIANHQACGHNDSDDGLSHRGKCEGKNQRLADTTRGNGAPLIGTGFARLEANPAGK